MSLLVVVPTRGHVDECKRFIDSFDATVDNADLLFVLDGDDKSYAGFDWQGHTVATMSPRGSLTEKLNFAASQVIEAYDQLMYVPDDSVFVTEHWDTLLLDVLAAELGGSGIVYPNDLRRIDIPETWLISTDVLRTVGWFALPLLKQFYMDNAWSDLGKRTDLIRFVPDVVVDRSRALPDTEGERLYGMADQQNYMLGWRGSSEVAAIVSQLRRNFNPDVKWVLSKI